MAHTNKNKDAIDWIDGLAQGLGREGDEVPEGWLNARQIGAKINRSRETAARHARLGVDAGRLKMRKFRIKSGDRILPIPHYKEVRK